MHPLRVLMAAAVVVGSVSMLSTRPDVASESTIGWMQAHTGEIEVSQGDFALAVAAVNRASTNDQIRAACGSLNAQVRQSQQLWNQAPPGELTDAWLSMLESYAIGATRCVDGDIVAANADFDVAKGHRARVNDLLDS